MKYQRKNQNNRPNHRKANNIKKTITHKPKNLHEEADQVEILASNLLILIVVGIFIILFTGVIVWVKNL